MAEIYTITEIALLDESNGEVESELAPPPGEDMETCFKRITSETQMLIGRWKETLQYAMIQLQKDTPLACTHGGPFLYFQFICVCVCVCVCVRVLKPSERPGSA